MSGGHTGEEGDEAFHVEAHQGEFEGAAWAGDFEDAYGAAGLEDAVEFLKRRGEVGEMAQCVTHGEEVEMIGGERQFFGGRERGAEGEMLARFGEHAAAEVNCDDALGGAGDVDGFARD